MVLRRRQRRRSPRKTFLPHFHRRPGLWESPLNCRQGRQLPHRPQGSEPCPRAGNLPLPLRKGDVRSRGSRRYPGERLGGQSCHHLGFSLSRQVVPKSKRQQTARNRRPSRARRAGQTGYRWSHRFHRNRSIGKLPSACCLPRGPRQARKLRESWRDDNRSRVGLERRRLLSNVGLLQPRAQQQKRPAARRRRERAGHRSCRRVRQAPR